MPTTPKDGKKLSFQRVMNEEKEHDYIIEELLGSPIPPSVKIRKI